jgi:hypothetical protein
LEEEVTHYPSIPRIYFLTSDAREEASRVRAEDKFVSTKPRREDSRAAENAELKGKQ